MTKSLLGYGVIAGPFYVLASVLQGALTPGFSFSRDSWSLLSLGAAGWVHIGVFVLTGLMTVAAAVGIRRHLRGSMGATAWAWLATYGLLLVAAGVAVPDRPQTVPTAHGLGHLAAGGLGFIAFAVATFVLARRFRHLQQGSVAVFSVASGVLLLGGFVLIAAAASSPAAVLVFTAAVVIAWAWLAIVSLRFYREAAEVGRRDGGVPVAGPPSAPEGMLQP